MLKRASTKHHHRWRIQVSKAKERPAQNMLPEHPYTVQCTSVWCTMGPQQTPWANRHPAQNSAHAFLRPKLTWLS